MWVAEVRREREQVASVPATHVTRERKEALGYRAAKPGQDQGQQAARHPGQAAGLQWATSAPPEQGRSLSTKIRSYWQGG